jgi:hypothetical protein
MARPPLKANSHEHVVPNPCPCHANAVQMPCPCRAHAMPMLCPCPCHAHAMPCPCRCRAPTMPFWKRLLNAMAHHCVGTAWYMWKNKDKPVNVLSNIINVIARIFCGTEVQCGWNVAARAIPLQAWTGPEGSRNLTLPDFKTIGTWRW